MLQEGECKMGVGRRGMTCLGAGGGYVMDQVSITLIDKPHLLGMDLKMGPTRREYQKTQS